MNRKNKILFVLSILVILAPLVIGLVFWERLSAAFPLLRGFMLCTVLFLPLFFLLLHILCVLTTLRDHRKNGQSEKIVTLSICILPIIALFTSLFMYIMVLKNSFVPYVLVYILLGALMILMGNYMPKARRNRFFGIKTVWTLSNDEIWTKTHRFTGKVSVVCGALLLLCALLPQSIPLLICAILASALLSAIVPIVYSYVIYKRAVKSGALAPDAAKPTKKDKIARAISIPAIIVILTVCALLMFTGSIDFTVGDSALSVDATYWRNTEIFYTDIESAALVDDADATRLNGFASAVLSLGIFSSEEYGDHTRFAYVNSEAYILLSLKDGSRVILSERTEAETTALYEALLAKIS